MNKRARFFAVVTFAAVFAAIYANRSFSHRSIASAQTQTPPADLVLRNGRIVTVDDRMPEAQALAARGGKIVFVGTSADVAKFVGPTTQVIDLNGRRVVPGLNDSHLHVIRGGLNYNMELRWDGVPSLADALRMLKEQAERTPPGQWIRVVGGWTAFQGSGSL